VHTSPGASPATPSLPREKEDVECVLLSAARSTSQRSSRRAPAQGGEVAPPPRCGGPLRWPLLCLRSASAPRHRRSRPRGHRHGPAVEKELAASARWLATG
jgi:hypothetical protein